LPTTPEKPRTQVRGFLLGLGPGIALKVLYFEGMNWKENLPDVGLLILRVVPSGLMMTHGWPKMNRLFDQWGSEEGVKFFDFLGLGPEVSLILTVLAELVAPVLMVVGWKTRWAALPAAFTMGVAAFVVHGGDPIGDKELALLYLVCFAAVAALGGGRWSLDSMRNMG